MPIENTLQVNGKRPRLVHGPRAGPGSCMSGSLVAARVRGLVVQKKVKSLWTKGRQRALTASAVKERQRGMSPTTRRRVAITTNGRRRRTALVALSSCGLQIPGDVCALAPSPVGRGCRTTALSILTEWPASLPVARHRVRRCHGVSAWTMTMILPSARESPPSPGPQPGAGPQAGPGPRRPTRLSPRPAHSGWHSESLTRSAAPPRRSKRLRRAAAQAEWPAVHRTLRTRLAQ